MTWKTLKNMLRRLLSVPGIALILIGIIGLSTLLKNTQYLSVPLWGMAILALALVLMFQGKGGSSES